MVYQHSTSASHSRYTTSVGPFTGGWLTMAASKHNSTCRQVLSQSERTGHHTKNGTLGLTRTISSSSYMAAHSLQSTQTIFSASVQFAISNFLSTTETDLSMTHNTEVTETVDAGSDGCLESQQGDFVPWNNPDNIVSKETEFWISVTISAGAIPFLWVVGSVGNVLSCVVFFRQGLSSRINLCLFYLALADLFSITVLFLLYAEGAYRLLVGPAHFFITYFVGLTAFTFVSQMLSTVIACERCFCVMSPLKAQGMVSTRKMGIAVTASSLVLIAGVLAVIGPKHTMACVTDPVTKVSTDIVYVTRYYLNNQEILDIFDVFVFSTAFPAMCLVIIVVTTIITAGKLKSALKWRHQNVSDVATIQLPSSDRVTSDKPKTHATALPMKEVALTRMLIATSLLFVICLTPSFLVQAATFMIEDLRYNGRYHNFITVLWAVVSFFRVLNSSVNFFVYYAMGSKFRETLKEFLPKLC